RRHPPWATTGSPGSRARCFRTCSGSLTARSPAASRDVDATSIAFRRLLPRRRSGGSYFRGSVPGPHVPLSTLRRRPCEWLRMTRGRCGSLLLHRMTLSFTTPCRFDRRTGDTTMESTLQKPALSAITPKAITIAYRIVTGLFCLQMGFTAYAQLNLPEVAQAFAHLGFPDYFRVELSLAKFAGIALLVAPVPARLKEWAYAGFAIDLTSAVIAHLAVGEGPEAWGWAAGTGVLWGLSYYFWRRRLAALAQG